MSTESAGEPSDYWEREYNPRVRVNEPQVYFDAWAQRAQAARAYLNGMIDLSYGPHERQRLDFFRAESAHGTLVFIHGGYWRAFSKDSYSWVADTFVKAGISVAVPSYPLAPQANLATIVQSIAGVVPYLRSEILTPGEQRKVVLVGHSAGAHLAACFFTQSGVSKGAAGADAALGISGLYDLAPLLHTRMLGGMGWTCAELHAVSPLFMPQPPGGRLVLAVGGAESEEFHSQTRRFARAWPDRVAATLTLAGKNHFNVLEGLQTQDDELARAALALMR